MRFANHIAEIDISGIRKSFEAAGADSINLGLGQPDFETPGHVKEAAIEAIKEGDPDLFRRPDSRTDVNTERETEGT